MADREEPAIMTTAELETIRRGLEQLGPIVRLELSTGYLPPGQRPSLTIVVLDDGAWTADRGAAARQIAEAYVGNRPIDVFFMTEADLLLFTNATAAQVTWEDVRRRALYDAVLHRAVTLAELGAVTREAALIAVVLYLSRDRERLIAEAVTRLSRGESPIGTVHRQLARFQAEAYTREGLQMADNAERTRAPKFEELNAEILGSRKLP
jgi:hypothetical protein